MVILLLIYLVVGIGYFPVVRTAGGATKALYFVIFPFHAILIPLVAGLYNGFGMLFNGWSGESIGFAIAFFIFGLLALIGIISGAISGN